MIDEVLKTLLQLGPVVSILIAVIIYLYKSLGKRDEQIDELNLYIRESDKANIIILDKVTHTLDKLSDKDDTNTDKVLTELRGLRDAILLRLEK